MSRAVPELLDDGYGRCRMRRNVERSYASTTRGGLVGSCVTVEAFFFNSDCLTSSPGLAIERDLKCAGFFLSLKYCKYFTFEKRLPVPSFRDQPPYVCSASPQLELRSLQQYRGNTRHLVPFFG
jgi:hypothetical protein